MKNARLCISPLDHSNEFGHPVRVSAYTSGIEDFDVLLELMTDRDKIKILCSSEWAMDFGKTLQACATKAQTGRKSKCF
jgi:hypothetical protein